MQKLLKTYFGYDKFRPLQQEIINNVLQKKDTFVLMPTGGGKSLCYQLPALKLGGLTLVISPLISLMKDQVDSLKANGIAAEFINSSLAYQEINRIQQEIVAGKIKILYVAPERLALGHFQDFLQSLSISLIAVDEAHCISEWGHDFRPDYCRLKFLKKWFAGVPIISLTATATAKVQADIVSQLSLNQPKMCVSSFDRENLTFWIVRKRDAFAKLLGILDKHKNKSAIIYCFSRRETENIAESLKIEGFKALPYHAGLDNAVRKKNQELFIKDEVQIMVATIAFGMGIDKPDVRLVVHYTFPKTLEGYYQEIGRAGRDGLPSECVLFYSYGDKIKHEYFINEIEDFQEQANARQKLDKVIEFCEQTNCRRKFVLSYFGEEYKKENCQACDACLSTKKSFDGTDIARKIILTVARTDARFGKNYIADILSGRQKKQIVENGHDKLPVFGIVQDYNSDEIKNIINSLIELSLLQKRPGQYPTIFVTKKGAQWIKQKQTLTLTKTEDDYHDQLKEGPVKDSLQYDSELFEKLRILRKEIAAQNNVPPFVIFSDVSLREMAYYFPVNQESFSGIQGVGEKKMQSFGKEFLTVINDYVKENQLSPKQIPDYKLRSRNRARRKINTGDPRYKKTKEMINHKLSLAEIAESHGLKERTIINHIEKLAAAEEDIDIKYLAPAKDRFNEIQQALIKCGDERLKPVYEFLGERYSYDEICLVRIVCKK